MGCYFFADTYNNRCKMRTTIFGRCRPQLFAHLALTKPASTKYSTMKRAWPMRLFDRIMYWRWHRNLSAKILSKYDVAERCMACI